MLDNFSTGNRANLEGLDVEVVEGELRSYERVHNAVRGVEVVYHLGALGSVPALGAGSAHLERRQRRGHAQRPARRARRGRAPRRLLVVARRCTARAASCRRPRTTPPDPISPYGVAKLAAERYCVSFSRVYESFETVVLRYFNVFGPRQSPHSQYAAVVPLFITAIDAGRAGHDPRRRRAVARLHLRRERRRRDDARGRRGGRERPHLQRRRRRAGEREPGRRDDRRASSASRSRGATRRRAPATSATRGPTSPRRASVLGYEPRVGLEEGLRLTAEAIACAGLSQSRSCA